MSRQIILNLLDRYQPNDPGQLRIKAKMINFVQTHADCFERELELGHMTASAWLLNAVGDQVLLTHHKKLNKWLQLGGHADGDPDLLQVAIKEAQEESGIQHIEAISRGVFDIDVHPIPARKNEPEHDHWDVRFLLRVTDPAAQYVVSDESHDLRWFTHSELAALEVDASVKRMARKWAI